MFTGMPFGDEAERSRLAATPDVNAGFTPYNSSGGGSTAVINAGGFTPYAVGAGGGMVPGLATGGNLNNDMLLRFLAGAAAPEAKSFLGMPTSTWGTLLTGAGAALAPPDTPMARFGEFALDTAKAQQYAKAANAEAKRMNEMIKLLAGMQQKQGPGSSTALSLLGGGGGGTENATGEPPLNPLNPT